MHTKRKWSSRDIALCALLAALYAAYVFYFSVTSFAVIQVRVVDAFLPLVAILGLPAVAGVTLGVFVGNLLGSPFGPVDVVGGTVANLIAGLVGWWIGSRKFKGAWVTAIVLQIAIVTVVVGSYLISLTASPDVPIWVGWIEFLASETIAIGILGYPLLRAVERATKGNPAVKA